MVERMTMAEYQKAHGKKKKQGRVRGTRRTTIGSESFDSQLEADHWLILKQRERDGDITDLKRQVDIPLQGRDHPILTPGGRPMVYRADFTWCNRTGDLVVGDAKGMITEKYAMKKAVLAAQGIEVVEMTREDLRMPWEKVLAKGEKPGRVKKRGRA